MKGKILILVCTVSILAVAFLMFTGEDAEVQMVRAGAQDITLELNLSGEFLPGSTYNVTSTAAGLVQSVHVSEGDTVLPQTPLVTMGVPAENFGDALAASGSDVSNYSMMQGISRAQNSSLSIAEFASFMMSTPDIAVSSSSTSSTIRSDVTGEIIAVNCVEGQSISAGVVTAVIASEEKIISVPVSQNDISDIKLGQRCTFKIEGRELEYVGEVSEIANTVHSLASGQKVIAVEILPVSDIDALTGSDVDVSIILEKKYGVLSVRGDCLVTADSLYVVNSQGVIELREVQTGLMDDDYVEILQGVQENELVVLNPERTLMPGDKVVAIDNT